MHYDDGRWTFNFEAKDENTIWVDRKLWHGFMNLDQLEIVKTDKNWLSCCPICVEGTVDDILWIDWVVVQYVLLKEQ